MEEPSSGRRLRLELGHGISLGALRWREWLRVSSRIGSAVQTDATSNAESKHGSLEVKRVGPGENGRKAAAIETNDCTGCIVNAVDDAA